MNQLSKYGSCSSLQHTHALPVQSGRTSPPSSLPFTLIQPHGLFHPPHSDGGIYAAYPHYAVLLSDHQSLM